MSEQSAADSGARLPFAGTTSDGQAADFRPARKIKPPSDTFLKKSEEGVVAVPVAEAPPAEPAVPNPLSAAASPLLGPASPEVELSGPAPVGIINELSGPAPVVRPVPKPEPPPEPPAPPPPAPAAAAPAPEPSDKEKERANRAQSSYTHERLQAELKELDQIVSSLDSLKFLQGRLQKTYQEGADAITLVSFYRLTARALLDEVSKASQTSDQFRREFETQRSKMSRMELEMATSEAQAPREVKVKEADPGAAAKITALEAEVAQVNAQREKLLVDFKNSRDRTQKDIELRIFKEKEKFFRNFLPVLDSFERASQTMGEAQGTEALLAGFQMISHQLAEALKLEGLDPVDTSGMFNPQFHEAVSFVETQEKADEFIFDELSRGYQMGERLIRPAMVRVARNPSGIVVSNKPATVEETAAEKPQEEIGAQE